MKQKIRNFPVEPYASRARLLLHAAVGMVVVSAMTWMPGLVDHLPTLVSKRWWFLCISVLAVAVSLKLHRRGRRI